MQQDLAKREQIQSGRSQFWEPFVRESSDWSAANDVLLPTIPPGCEQSYHMFCIMLPSLDRGQALISYLLQRGNLAVFHYLPLHLSPMGRRFGGCGGDCPVTEKVSERLLGLPFDTGTTKSEQAHVIVAVRAFRC